MTRPEDRGRAFGLVGVAFGVGFIIGPAVGGLLGQFGHRVPFFAAALFSLANLVFGWLFLPESLPREARRPFDLRQANPLGALAALRASPALGPLAATLFLFSLAQSVYIAVWPYAVMDRYGWGEGLVGVSLACVGVAAIVNQGLLVGPLVARLGERRAALLGLSTALFTSGGYALATRSWMVFALIAVGGLQGIVMPAVTALMSRDVPADRQGEVQGAIGSLQGIAAICRAAADDRPFQPRDATGRSCPLAGCTLRFGLGPYGHGGAVPLDRQASARVGRCRTDLDG